jgi:hypothetical protein
MGARICPRCSTRVDERRARTSPYCLSCGAPLGPSPSSTFAGKAPGAGGSSSLPWILGGIAAVVLLGFGVVVIVLVAAAGAAAPEPDPSAAPAVSAAQPRVETADAGPAASVTGTKVASTAPTVRTPRPTATVVPVPTPPPTFTAPPTATVTTLGPFPRSKAQNEVDRIGFGLASCKSSAGPFGAGTMRIDFEPDGRVGTVTRPPFAGTSVGTCISARFRTIKIGPFTGSTQSIEKSFIIQE